MVSRKQGVVRWQKGNTYRDNELKRIFKLHKWYYFIVSLTWHSTSTLTWPNMTPLTSIVGRFCGVHDKVGVVAVSSGRLTEV